MPGHDPPARAQVATPGLEPVRGVLAAIEAAGMVAAVGGSGLLAALGLIDRVRDWDITVDADPQAVREALAAGGIDHLDRPAADGLFATKARLGVDGGDHDVDIIIGFAVRTDDRIVALPTLVTGSWLGLPLADPDVWARAYRLLGRHDRADRLDAWLGTATWLDTGRPRTLPRVTPLSELPRISAPATRALNAAGYTRLDQLAGLRRADLAKLHGMGPKAVNTIEAALEQHGLRLA
jgi:hypothetical protein